MEDRNQEATKAVQNNDDDGWETDSDDENKKKRMKSKTKSLGQQRRSRVTRPDLESLLGLAEETNAFLLALMSDPHLNMGNVLASPKPLFFTCDFQRRTYLEYVVPLFPTDALRKVVELANPFVFEYSDRGVGTVFDKSGGYKPESGRAWLENEAQWPEWNANLNAKFFDAIGRNTMLAQIVLQRDGKGPMLMQGRYDFQPATLELAQGLSREEVGDWKQRLADARIAAGLAG